MRGSDKGEFIRDEIKMNEFSQLLIQTSYVMRISQSTVFFNRYDVLDLIYSLVLLLVHLFHCRCNKCIIVSLLLCVEYYFFFMICNKTTKIAILFFCPESFLVAP